MSQFCFFMRVLRSMRPTDLASLEFIAPNWLFLSSPSVHGPYMHMQTLCWSASALDHFIEDLHFAFWHIAFLKNFFHMPVVLNSLKFFIPRSQSQTNHILLTDLSRESHALRCVANHVWKSTETRRLLRNVCTLGSSVAAKAIPCSYQQISEVWTAETGCQINVHCFMPSMLCPVLRSVWTWLIQYEQGHICYFFLKSCIFGIPGLKRSRDRDRNWNPAGIPGSRDCNL